MNLRKLQYNTPRMPLAKLSIACAILSSPILAQDDDDVYTLDAIVVRPIEWGSEAALREQKESNTISTIVSEETLENLPDQSIGEALARLPGISIVKDRGEAEQITIRGLDPRLNAVMINGDRLPSPESTVGGASRSAKVNSIPATLIKGIEVFKAVPAEMDADSVGGAVEIKTKNATELEDTLFDVVVRYGHNDLPSEDLYSAEFTYGFRFGEENNMGLMIAGSWEENNRAVESPTADWGTEDEFLDLTTGEEVSALELTNGQFDELWRMSNYRLQWRDLKRIRSGANIAFDWKPGENTLFKIGGFYSEFEDNELRRDMQVRFNSSSDWTTDSVWENVDGKGIITEGAVDGGRVRKRHRPGTKLQKTENYFFEGQHFFNEGDWNLDYRISSTVASRELTRTRARFEARSQDLGLRDDGVIDLTYTFDDLKEIPQFTNPQNWINDPNVLEVGNRGDYLQRRGDLSEDAVDAALINLERVMNLESGELRLKIGGKQARKDYFLDNNTFNFEVDEDRTIYMVDVFGDNRTTPVRPVGQDNGEWADMDLVNQLFINEPDRFLPDGDDTEDSYDIDEDITAGYLQATWKSGDWRVVAGARYEETDFSILASDGSRADNTYDNWFPSVILRYQPTDPLVFRAAWTNSIGRPDYRTLRPFFDTDFEWELDDDTGEYTGEISMDGGNPLLEPFEAENFDLGFEYYMPQGGVFSVGLFYKEVENFEDVERFREEDVQISSLAPYLQDIINREVDEARQDNAGDGDPDNDIPAGFNNLADFDFTRPVNGDVATYTGVEIAYQQKFNKLPEPFNNLGVIANYTYVDGEADFRDGISRDFVLNQFDDVGNLQLYYETEKYSARFAYNRNGVSYDTIDITDEGVSRPDRDRGLDVEESLDFSFQYRIDGGNANYTLYFDIRNLTDEPSVQRFQDSVGQPIFREFENGGRTFILGAKISL